MIPTIQSLEEKKHLLDRYKPFSLDLVKNLNAWFTIELTYTSNAIEGNTLSRAETALIVEKGLTVNGKTIQEHLEAINHAAAFSWIIKHASTHQMPTERMILDIHEKILQKIDDTNAGRYRTVSVRIAGSTVILPNAMKVPALMSDFVAWLQSNTDHPVKRAIDAHFKLVSIHPFVDGNGRTARLLMNFFLLQAGYPPAIIRKEDRKVYIASIEKAQLGGSYTDYMTLMEQAIDRSLTLYLDMVENKHPNKKQQKMTLLKIGDLAKRTKESTATIRHWTKEGILKAVDQTPGGYQLYPQEAVETVQKIRSLQQEKRLTLKEIKKRLE